MPVKDQPIDPRPAIAALLGAYLTNAYGSAPPDAPEKLAEAFAAKHQAYAEGLRKWLAGHGAGGAAAMYMARLHNHAQSGTLAAQPRPGQVGGAVLALRLLRQLADSMLHPSGASAQ